MSGWLYCTDMVESDARSAHYYPALDGFRAVAVLLVFCHHYLGSVGGRVRPVPFFGWIGVDLFFVLSGFLITGILYDSRHTGGRLTTFYMRRVLRIFPLYYGVLLLLLLYGVAKGKRFAWQLAMWPLHLGNYARFMGHHHLPMIDQVDMLTVGHWPTMPILFGHFWSLCLEEQFYLVWPLAVFAVRDRRRLVQVCVGAIVVCPVLRMAAEAGLPGWMVEREVVYRALPLRFDALLMGGLLALLVRGPAREWLGRWRGWICGAGLVGLAGVFWLEVARTGVPAPFGVLDRSLPMTGFGYSVVDVAAAGVILFLLRGESVAARVLQWGPLQGLGRISYGFYVFHDLFHYQYGRWSGESMPQHPTVGLVGMALVGTTVLAAASYRCYELPFLRLKARWSGERHLAPVA